MSDVKALDKNPLFDITSGGIIIVDPTRCLYLIPQEFERNREFRKQAEKRLPDKDYARIKSEHPLTPDECYMKKPTGYQK